MSRKKRDYKRIIKPDSVFHSPVITSFINKVMKSGKKSVAEGIVYESLKILGTKAELDPLKAFEKALKNVAPVMEVKSRRVGGSTYQVPVEVTIERGVALAMKWLIDNARKRGGHSMKEKLSNELVDAFQKLGASIKKREETHKMAESNKAFAHFRW